jgi:membrane protein implicated in regulation of membrane protease activity
MPDAAALHLALVGFDFSQELVYLVCAVLGGSVLVLQTLAMLFGFGGLDDLDGLDADVELGGTDGAFGFLSIRSFSAFLTIFGLTGWGGLAAGWPSWVAAVVSLGAGLLMMALVAWLFSLQKHLYSDGNLHPEKLVGQTGRVYLRIPAKASGKGKITVSIQGRSEQFEASTATDDERELPTGSEVRITRMITPGSFEVEAV